MRKRSEKLKKLGLVSSLVAASVAAVISGNASAAMQIRTEGGLKVFDPANPTYSFNLNGRLEFDEVIFSGSYRDRQKNYSTSANLRRALLAFSGGVGQDFTYALALDFGRTQGTWDSTGALTGTSHGHVAVEEAWVGYTGLAENVRFRIGQFTPPTTLDGYGNYGAGSGQMFLESAQATRAFSVPSYMDMDTRAMKGFGIGVDSHFSDTFTVAAALYQPAHGVANTSGDAGRPDRTGQALRITYSPIHDCDAVFHAGLSARHQGLNSTKDDAPAFNTTFHTTPEVNSRNAVGNPRTVSALTESDPNLLNVGAIRAKGYTHYAGELAGIYGPWTLAAEYHHVGVDRVALPNGTKEGRLNFNGWHAQAGYLLTGESRSYDFRRGSLGGVKPSNGNTGAWELVARYSYVNLINKDVYGGRGQNVTAGVNCYINEHIRVAMNYIRAEIRPTGATAGARPTEAAAIKRKLDILAARLQVVF